jgi:acyl carrier protein
MPVMDQVKMLLNDVLQLDGRASAWNENTPLLGNVPELDSMAVINVITALEEELGVTIADEDINADLFATVGTLARFVEEKQAA